ncbi:glomulin-like [Oscarella lobularis]|uniref:glomulin-like n=1 Tax=Oscarella lobularis TaxID=121494 RepID=UPI0033140DD5
MDLVDQLRCAASDFLTDREASNRFVVSVAECADRDALDAVSDVLANEQNVQLLQFCGWELVTVLASRQTEANSEKTRSLLELIAKTCNPREVILAIAEELERPINNLAFISLLQILRVSFSRMEGGWKKMLSMIRSPLIRRLGKESVDDMTALHSVLDACGAFVESLISRYSSDDADVQMELGLLLVSLLGPPVVFSSSQFVANFSDNVMTWIRHIRLSSIRLLEVQKSSMAQRNNDEENIPKLACASYSYIMFIRGHGLEFFPQVYHPVYLLSLHLTALVELLSEDLDCVTEKGLALFSYLVQRIDAGSVSTAFLNDKQVLSLAQSLISVMTGRSLKQLRRTATEVLPRYLACLEASQRVSLILTLLAQSNHSGVSGLLIYIIKEDIMRFLNGQLGLSRCDVGKLLDVVTSFRDDDDEILRDSDRIMSVLNLLRFLLLRDKENETGVWQKWSQIKQTFIQPLQTAISKAKEEWIREFELAELPTAKGPETEVEILNEGILPPPANRKDLAKSALLTIDIMESVVRRITEIATITAN